MAGEFKWTPSLIYENGTLKAQFQPGTIQLPQATKGFMVLTQTFTTAEADITVGTGVATPGYAILHNLEASTTGKTLNWGLKSSTGGIPTYFKLPPKSFALINYGTSAMVLRGKAASGSLLIWAKIFES